MCQESNAEISDNFMCFRLQCYVVRVYCIYRNYFSFSDDYKYGKSVQATAASVSSLIINSGTNCVIIVHGHGGKGTNDMNLVLRDGMYI